MKNYFNKISAGISFFLLLALVCSAEKEPGKPNIVIIYADDMGYGDLNIQNPDSKIPTPFLDQLAIEGMRFTDAHSSSGVCTPSRYALLTGRYHWRQGEGIVGSWGGSWFDNDRLTLPAMLQEKGYRTACIGKWHLGWEWEAIRNTEVGNKNHPDAHDWSKPVPGGPLDHGFDYYFGDDVPNFPPYTWIENDRFLQSPTVAFKPIPVPTNTLDGAERGEGHDCRPGPMVEGWRLDEVMPRLTGKAVEWIWQQNADQPFFLYWAWTAPHTPVVPVGEYQGSTGAGAYGDYMHQIDAHLGEVLQALKDNGFADNTLIMFTSDNGPESIAYPRIQNHDHYSMGSLRGVKQDVWEGGHRVPFIVRWPGVVEANTVSRELVSQVDVMGTIASIVGYELPNNAAEDSHDLLPLLRGESDRSGRETLVHRTWKKPWGIRHGDWLYINAPTGSVQKEPEWRGYSPNPHEDWLNNMREDSGQQVNLVSEYPERVKSLRNQLEAIRESLSTAPRRSNELREALQPLPKEAVFKMEGYYLWDPSVIKVDDTYHLFTSRWPEAEGMIGWKKSHIIRATSKSLFGPYTFAGVVYEPKDHPWATEGMHNPKIIKAGNRFLLYHLGIPAWKTGFLFADNIEGPWTAVQEPVISTNNPALCVKPDGKVYVVGKFKPKPVKDGKWDAYMQAFEADSILGPYRLVGDEGNRLPNNYELEDPTLWWANNQYNVVCTDWEAKVTGITKALVYYTSKDGINYQLHSKVPVWSKEDQIPVVGGDNLEVRGTERPQVYLDEQGRVTALLVSVYPKDNEVPTYIIIRPVDKFVPVNYHVHREGIRNSLIKFQRVKKGRVAFLGGSITYNGGWRDSICHYLQERFPDTEFEFIAAGIPSMGSTPAAFRLERDVLAGGPVDLLFEEAAVNDAVNGRSSEEQIRAMEGIVRHVRSVNPATDIVIMHFVDPQKMDTYRSGQVPEVIQNHEKVAAHYGLPTIHLAREVTDRIDAGEFTWEEDFKNLHPSPFGQGIYSRSVITFLEKAWREDVAVGDKILAYPQSEPLDRACYENGKLIPTENATIVQGWEMAGNWTPQDGKKTRPNYVNVPMLVGEREGSLLEFRFTGNAVGIAVAAGPDAGIIEYQIDDGAWLKKDIFTHWSKNLHLPWYVTLAADLPDEAHMLKIRITGDKNPQSNGTACRIRYFFVNE